MSALTDTLPSPIQQEAGHPLQPKISSTFNESRNSPSCGFLPEFYLSSILPISHPEKKKKKYRDYLQQFQFQFPSHSFLFVYMALAASSSTAAMAAISSHDHIKGNFISSFSLYFHLFSSNLKLIEFFFQSFAPVSPGSNFSSSQPLDRFLLPSAAARRRGLVKPISAQLKRSDSVLSSAASTAAPGMHRKGSLQPDFLLSAILACVFYDGFSPLFY